ncbi:MAG TPA: NAD(P)H-dependent oxidoreductase [Caulobacteraceae bacterium]|jgi:FMN-dependent NADH-azoreductase|nr:NAD(P)H-dependent oxidoreductase [Caulobacteraceae bacterium]
MKLLHIDSGITGTASVSRQISAAVVQSLKAANPSLEVVYRDLEANPLPHLNGAGLPSLAESDPLAEFLAADIVVIGAPMYNFGIASQLKAWFDRVLVAGKTFRYTQNGPEGLAAGKRVIIASARGGAYADGAPAAVMDFHEPYLRALFGFVGVPDVEFIRAEGVVFSPEHRTNALNAALSKAADLKGGLKVAVAA